MITPSRILTVQLIRLPIPQFQIEWYPIRKQIDLTLRKYGGFLNQDKVSLEPDYRYREYIEQQEALHAAWVEKKEARDEAIARGEKVGPLEPDPTAPEEVGLLGLLKFIVIALFCIALAGKFITGSYTWESDNKWLQAKTYFTVSLI